MRSAKVIVAEMNRCLSARYFRRIGRRKFLSWWSSLREQLYATPEYVEWRAGVFERAGGKCEGCGGVGEEAHHKRPVAKAPHLALDPKNGECLCRPCHDKKPRHKRRAA
jgi:5-methylcytosine-specific restriction endonuclease McrA